MIFFFWKQTEFRYVSQTHEENCVHHRIPLKWKMNRAFFSERPENIPSSRWKLFLWLSERRTGSYISQNTLTPLSTISLLCCECVRASLNSASMMPLSGQCTFYYWRNSTQFHMSPVDLKYIYIYMCVCEYIS